MGSARGAEIAGGFVKIGRVTGQFFGCSEARAAISLYRRRSDIEKQEQSGVSTRRQLEIAVEGRSVWVEGDESVITWIESYVGGWWTAQSTMNCGRRRFVGKVGNVWQMPSPADNKRERVETYFGTIAEAWRKDGAVFVVVDGGKIGYCWDAGSQELVVIGLDPAAVAIDLNRIARAALTAELEGDGWVMVHAACVVDGDAGAVVVGPKGSGKSTTALGLAAGHSFGLLGNDRCFARVEDGHIRCIAWPGSVAVGLGLLNALGWTEVLAKGLREGARNHPAQRAEVVRQILRGDSRSLFERGKELKYEILPRQFSELFGIQLVREGYVTRLVLPRFEHDPAPVCAEDVVRNSTLTSVGDGYPNFLGVGFLNSKLSASAVTRVIEALCSLDVELPVFSKGRDRNPSTLEQLAERIRGGNVR